MPSENDKQGDSSSDKEEVKEMDECEPEAGTLDNDEDISETDATAANQWTSDDVANCGFIFNLLDKDGDGKLNAVDIAEAMAAINQPVTMDEATEAINFYDTNGHNRMKYALHSSLLSLGDGSIDLQEFMNIVKDHPFCFTENEELLAAFKMLDRNRDGFIDEDDLKNSLGHLNMWVSDEEARAMINMGDLDRDGKLAFQEFVPIWRIIKREAGL